MIVSLGNFGAYPFPSFQALCLGTPFYCHITSRFFRKVLFENNLNFQKSCKNKNCTKNTHKTCTQIHLLAFYPICFVVCSLSLYMCVCKYFFSWTIWGQVTHIMIFYCTYFNVHFPRIRILNNHNTVIKFSKFHIDTILSLAVCIPVLSIDPIYPLQHYFLLQHRIWSRVRYYI